MAIISVGKAYWVIGCSVIEIDVSTSYRALYLSTVESHSLTLVMICDWAEEEAEAKLYQRLALNQRLVITLSLIHILVRVLQKLKFLSCILSKDFLHQGQACLERFRSISDKLDLLILGLGDLAALGNLLWHLLVSEKQRYNNKREINVLQK